MKKNYNSAKIASFVFYTVTRAVNKLLYTHMAAITFLFDDIVAVYLVQASIKIYTGSSVASVITLVPAIINVIRVKGFSSHGERSVYKYSF